MTIDYNCHTRKKQLIKKQIPNYHLKKSKADHPYRIPILTKSVVSM